MINRYPIDKT